MKMLPLFIRFKFCHRGWNLPALWFPIVLLWPIVLILVLPVIFLGFIAVVLLDSRSVRRFSLLCGGLYAAFCELRGTRVDVESPEGQLFIAIY